jgi:putative zinc finger/helix-turn-helix YgiT family protein
MSTPPKRRFPRTCLSCNEKQVVQAVIDRIVEVKYDGSIHRVAVNGMPVERCDHCGAVSIGLDGDDAINAALREQLGLLSPAEIRACRKSLSLTQKQLAAELMCAEESISRWESGAVIQSRSYDRLMRAFFCVPAVRSLFEALDRGEKPALVTQDGSHFVAFEVDWLSNLTPFTSLAVPKWEPTKVLDIPAMLPHASGKGSPFPRYVPEGQPRAA